jgi:hypothetical protein
MVELQIVVLVVAGSSPVGHPSPKAQIPGSNVEQVLLLVIFRLLLLALDCHSYDQWIGTVGAKAYCPWTRQ